MTAVVFVDTNTFVYARDAAEVFVAEISQRIRR
jgi:hypothetical protein